MLLREWLVAHGLPGGEAVVILTLTTATLIGECSEPQAALDTVTRGLSVAVHGSSVDPVTAH
jgi:hypothetical protein